VKEINHKNFMVGCLHLRLPGVNPFSHLRFHACECTSFLPLRTVDQELNAFRSGCEVCRVSRATQECDNSAHGAAAGELTRPLPGGTLGYNLHKFDPLRLWTMLEVLDPLEFGLNLEVSESSVGLKDLQDIPDFFQD
jgi:hypothetical protein